MAYSPIYEKLTGDPNDLVGALAYIIYKQQKVEYCMSYPNSTPSRDDLDRFHAVAALPVSLENYRAQGEARVRKFLDAALDKVAERTESETRENILYTHIGSTSTGLQSQLTTISTGLQSQLATISTGLQTQLASIDDTLAAKRTWLGWLRDVGGNLIVNVVTILVIGALVIGYQFLGNFQKHAEAKAGLNAAPGSTNSPPATTRP
jgi:hypothetical protein